jgi:dephospho-CoA kinase
MIIGLSGYAQSGKDTVAKYLVENHKFKRIAFADALRDMAYKSNPMVGDGLRLRDLVDDYGWDVAKQNSYVREYLQMSGLAAREVLNENVWVIAAINKMDGESNYVITDVRFQNEAVFVRRLRGQIWRVKRNNVAAVNNHISESALDAYKFDQIITNNGSIAELEDLIKKRMGLNV